MISQNSCRTRNDYSRSLARRPVGGRPLVISNFVFTRIELYFSFAELSVVHSHSVNEFWLDEGEYKRMYVSYVCVKVCQKLKLQFQCIITLEFHSGGYRKCLNKRTGRLFFLSVLGWALIRDVRLFETCAYS